MDRFGVQLMIKPARNQEYGRPKDEIETQNSMRRIRDGSSSSSKNMVMSAIILLTAHLRLTCEPDKPFLHTRYVVMRGIDRIRSVERRAISAEVPRPW